MGNFISFNCSNCFSNTLVSSLPWLAVIVSSLIVGTSRIILVPAILRSTRHDVVVYFHTVSIRPTVPAGVTNVFPIDPLGRPICRSFWFLWDLESINPHRCLLELLGQFVNVRGAVGDGLALDHHCVPVCHRRCCQFNEGIMGVLPSFSEVVRALVTLQPGGEFLFPLVFALCRLEVCLEVCPGFVGAFRIVPLVTVIIK